MSHLFHLGICGEPLVSESFEAWNLGPVLPSVYHRLKIFGDNPIRDIFHINTHPENEKKSLEVIEQVYEKLGKQDGYKLVKITHKEGGGWALNYEPRLNRTIPHRDVLEEYKSFYNGS